MVITLLKTKYQVGSGRGTAKIEKPGLLEKLNKIIDWDYCFYQDKENPVRKLEIGSVFTVGKDSQVFAIDSEDKIVLTITGTGSNALNRMWDEIFEPELNLLGWPEFPSEGYIRPTTLGMLDEEKLFEDGMCASKFAYTDFKIIQDKFFGKTQSNDFFMKVIYYNPLYFMKFDFYLTKNKIWYDPFFKDMPEDLLETVKNDIMKYLLFDFPRENFPYKKDEENRDVQQKIKEAMKSIKERIDAGEELDMEKELSNIFNVSPLSGCSCGCCGDSEESEGCKCGEEGHECTCKKDKKPKDQDDKKYDIDNLAITALNKSMVNPSENETPDEWGEDEDEDEDEDDED